MFTSGGSRPSASGSKEACRFRATIGLGSNLGDRAGNIQEAIMRVTADGSVRLVSRSRLYRTAPWGVTDQEWFVNACIAIATGLSPHELLRHCQDVEDGMGRVRTKRWGPRNIDVDILTFDNLSVRDPDLVIPHPLIADRAFVLIPLRDVAPDLQIEGVSLDALIGKLDASDVEPLSQ